MTDTREQELLDRIARLEAENEITLVLHFCC